MRLNFKWKKQTGLYQQGENLYLNKIHIASFSWNSARSQGEKDDSTRYIGNILLPSLSDTTERIYAINPKEIKFKIEQVIQHWFEEALKEGK